MMKARTALSIAVVLGLLAAPRPAGAGMRVTQSNGDWTNLEGISSDGNPMCVASLIGDDRQLMVKTFSSDAFVLHVFKEDWDIPEDLVVDIVLQVDNSPPVELVAEALGPSVKHGLAVFIHPEALWPHSNRPLEPELVNLLSSGKRFRLSFPDGDEPPWEGSLRGSAKTLNALADCRRRVRASRPTQPFGSKQGTSQALGRVPPPQPFGTMPPALPQDVEEDLSEGLRRVPKPAKPPG